MSEPARPPIALLTDFGLRDPYVGVMKGVIAARAPGQPVIDVTHGVPPQDLRGAGFALYQAVPYFPAGSLFVCVVDPGVGSRRAILWARGRRHQYLAPDNGVLNWIDELERIDEVRKVTNADLFAGRVSTTFHGRDIFAPVAAALMRGTAPAKLGPKARGMRRLPFPQVRRTDAGLRGEVLVVDRFGNAVTNVPGASVGKRARLSVRGIDVGPLRPSYSAVAAGKPLAIVGSAGFVELAVRDGNFARDVGSRAGEVVDVR